MRNAQTYDVIVVGSGMGGATLAAELTKRGKRVLVLERGRRAPSVGTFRDTIGYYDVTRILRQPVRSQEGVILWRTFMAGGSTMVSGGNGMRCLQDELSERGIEIEDELQEMEQRTQVAPLDERLISPGSRAIQDAARKLGYRMDPMPKFIDPVRCTRCGQCFLGCASGARWTALDFLDEAAEAGAEVAYETTVEEVIVEGGRARGVRAKGRSGEAKTAADSVVLCAGALTTPLLLQRNGVTEAGGNLSVDLMRNVYGHTPGPNLDHEPAMALVNTEFHEEQGFILASNVYHPRFVRFVEQGLSAFATSSAKLTGIMVKTRDDPNGRVLPNGVVSKPITEADEARLRAGVDIAIEILVKAGVNRRSIAVTQPQGAHPMGTAAVGNVVDARLETKIEGLFVCDASVLPRGVGLPPMLTIGALAKRLAKMLAS